MQIIGVFFFQEKRITSFLIIEFKHTLTKFKFQDLWNILKLREKGTCCIRFVQLIKHSTFLIVN